MQISEAEVYYINGIISSQSQIRNTLILLSWS